MSGAAQARFNIGSVPDRPARQRHAGRAVFGAVLCPVANVITQFEGRDRLQKGANRLPQIASSPLFRGPTIMPAIGESAAMGLTSTVVSIDRWSISGWTSWSTKLQLINRLNTIPQPQSNAAGQSDAPAEKLP
jgi:hypothetical protein